MSENGKASGRWVFEPQERRNEGWNQPGENHFAANPLSSLARETIQNSLDARAGKDQEGKNRPVRVRFYERMLRAEQIPGLRSLRDALKRCLDRSRERGGDRQESLQQMEAALEIMGEEEISVLSVADFGTFGMRGPSDLSDLKDDEETPCGKYLNSDGISGGKDRSGSHGIGKYAALRVSYPRCIIVSTAWEDLEGKRRRRRSLIQGHAVLRTHADEKGEKASGHGYWGSNDGGPLTEEQCPDEYRWLKRKEIGTTINIVGWYPRIEHVSMWDTHVLGHVASNFFSALEQNTLLVDIQRTEGKKGYALDKEKVGEVLAGELARKAMEDSGQEVGHDSKERKRFHNARLYHRCLRERLKQDAEGVSKPPFDVEGLGPCRISIKVFAEGTSAPNRFLLLRNDIWIKEMDNNFPSNEYKPFAGVVECLDEDGNELIREMEPVAHDDLLLSHLSGDRKKQAKLALKSLAENLKKVADAHASQEFESEDAWEHAAKFFPCEGEGEGSDGDIEFESGHEFRMGQLEEIKESGPSTLRVKGVRRKPEKKAKGEEGGARGRKRGKGGKRSGHGTGRGGGTGGSGQRRSGATGEGEAPQEMSLDDVRIVGTDSRSVDVFMTPDQDGVSLLSLYEVAADGTRRKAPVKSISAGGEVQRGGSVRVPLKKGKRVPLHMTLHGDFKGGLALSAQIEDTGKEDKGRAES